MAVNVDIPELGESVTEAILVEWLKQDGDYVQLDEPVCLIETDKADAELPARKQIHAGRFGNSTLPICVLQQSTRWNLARARGAH